MGAYCLAREHPRHVTLPLHLPDNVSPHPIHCHPTPYRPLPLGCQRRSRHFRITRRHLSRFISPCPHQGLWQSGAVSNHSGGSAGESRTSFSRSPPSRRVDWLQQWRWRCWWRWRLTLLKCAWGIIGGAYVPLRTPSRSHSHPPLLPPIYSRLKSCLLFTCTAFTTWLKKW